MSSIPEVLQYADLTPPLHSHKNDTMSALGVAEAGEGPVEASSPSRLVSAYSPLTEVARRIPWARTRRSRQRLCTFAVFSLGPTIVFWAWFLLQGQHDIRNGYHELIFAMPITALWITSGPLLMQRGEFGLERLLAALNETAAVGHWNLEAVQRAVDRADRYYYWTTLPITVMAVASVWLGSGTIASIVDISGIGARLGGIVVISSVGFATASGMWGCYKAVSIIRAATRTSPSAWLPFRSQQPSGIQALNEFCWSTALTFSVGSISLPTLFVVQSQLPAVARVIVLIFVGILAVGGLVLFTVPISWLRRIGGAQKDQILDALATPIEQSHDAVLHPDHYSLVELTRQGRILDMALKLRGEVSAQTPMPLPQLVSRGAATLILPLVLTLLQIAVTNVL